METAIATGLLFIALMMFFTARKHWVKTATLQVLNNLVGIVAFLAAILVLIIPGSPKLSPMTADSKP